MLFANSNTEVNNLNVKTVQNEQNL